MRASWRHGHKKPRILLLVTLSEWGGAQHVVYLLAKHLSACCEFTVACAPGGLLVSKLKQQQVRVVELPQLVNEFNPARDLQTLWKLTRWMRAERFDLVHIHSTKAGVLGRWAAARAGIPAVLFTAHGWAFTEGRAYWKRWLLAQMERAMAKRTTEIISVSHHDKRIALQFGVAHPHKITVIHNGVDPRPFLEADGTPLRAQLNAEARDEPLLTFVGRLAVQKDPLNLLNALRLLPRGRLALVGDGPLKPRVERFVRRHRLSDRVRVLGHREDVPHILAASDLFVLPSRWEGFPFTVIEAMLAGLPVVASYVGGVPELVEDGVTGFLVSPRDPEVLAEAVHKLIEHEELRNKMGRAGQEQALREGALERMLDKTREVYARLLKRAHHRR